MNIVEKILYIRKEARLMIKKAQDRMMQQTLRKKRRFIVGEEVLCHDLAKESWYSGKLELKWKRPYQIAAVQLREGDYNLQLFTEESI